MADQPSQGSPPRAAGSGAGTDGVSPGAPRWFKVFLLTAVAVVVLFVVLLVAGGAEHGPGRHTGGDAPPSVTDHVPPAGAHQR